MTLQIDDAGGRLSSSGCELLGVSDAGHLFPSTSRWDHTKYGTFEVESVARGRVDM